MKWIKWLYPGLNLKRWLFLFGLGTVLSCVGVTLIFNYQFVGLIEALVFNFISYVGGEFYQSTITALGLFNVVVGIFFMCYGGARVVKTVIRSVMPGEKESLRELIFTQQKLDKGPSVVVIGGGTGLSVLLRGIKLITNNCTAVVTTADDGGSSGRLRKEMGIVPTYYLVDTCAAEFEAYTPYFYSTYETGDELAVKDCRKVLILGGGPNRIGQGIEFDYCCCHASFALRDAGIMAIMANSNPETVSTDYDTSDRLYFEPLTFEDVMNIVEKEKPEGVIVQFGGQTPLNLAVPLMRAGVPILGTSPDAIDRAEDRERFQALIQKLGLLQPPNGTAMDLEEALEVAERITYPVVVRPSYVLGGRAMAVVYDAAELADYFREQVPEKPEHPILIDKFLEHAVEVDVDALSDGREVYVAGIMEHIEEAGIHSGDSACVLPSFSLSYDHVALIAAQAEALARELRVVGLMNIQFAIKGDDIYILEVNPRASRTAPFVSKATGVPLPYLATQVMLGKSLDELDPWSMRKGGFTCVKEAVMPFQRFPGVDIILGPEMHSTGEVMGMGSNFGDAFLKSQLGAGQVLPQGGKIFLSVNDRDKPFLPEVAAMFAKLGFRLLATQGTANVLREHGLEVEEVRKVYEGRPNIVDLLINHEVDLVINTASGKHTARDSKAIRRAALTYKVPYCTTIAAARATATAIGSRRDETHVESLQEYYAREARG